MQHLKNNENLPPSKPLDFGAIEESAKKIDHLFRAESEEHEWYGYHCRLQDGSIQNYESCKKCGVVRRYDHKNKPCKGVCKIGLREDEATCKDSLQVPKPLSFSEPLTKEAVGKFINQEECDRDNVEILDIGMTGNSLFADFDGFGKARWIAREEARNCWYFVESSDEITLEEAEKLTGKKIKR